jgi:hypothetical protein
MMLGKFSVALLAAIVLSPGENTGSSVPSQEHVKQVILSLPPDSEMRHDLERGDRGDGVHYPWMDRMKQLGAKRTRISLDFTWSTWRGRPVDIRVRRIALYNSYDEDCGQISNPERLTLIKKAGLEGELERFAIEETAKSRWQYIDKPGTNFVASVLLPVLCFVAKDTSTGKRACATQQGLATVELFDDEWLPRFSPMLMHLDGDPKAPRIAIDGDLVNLQETLKNKKFSQDDLDDALFTASVYLYNPCSIRLLLSAGANPNSRNTDGETPLMLAAYAGHLHSVEALLSGGADSGIRDVLGQTAADVALQHGHSAIAAVLAQHSR